MLFLLNMISTYFNFSPYITGAVLKCKNLFTQATAKEEVNQIEEVSLSLLAFNLPVPPSSVNAE